MSLLKNIFANKNNLLEKSAVRHHQRCFDVQTPIWLIYDSGYQLDINGTAIIEDPTGLIKFLRFKGRAIIKQRQSLSKITGQRRIAPVIFYEKDYRHWQNKRLVY